MPVQIAHRERPCACVVGRSELQVLDRTILIDAHVTPEAAVGGEVLIGLLRPMSHPVG